MTFTDALILLFFAAGGLAVVGLVILSAEFCARLAAKVLGPEWSLDSQPGPQAHASGEENAS